MPQTTGVGLLWYTGVIGTAFWCYTRLQLGIGGDVYEGDVTDFSQVVGYYKACLEFEDAARQVSWRDRHDQELRFENLLEAIDEPAVASFSVLDVGCGLGDLFGYLKRSGRLKGRYLGVDVVSEMIEAAKARHPEAEFELRDILQDPPEQNFDLVVCSGSLTVKVPGHERFVARMLAQMVELAQMAVAVNFQSGRAAGRGASPLASGALYYAGPLRFCGLCRRLCRWTALREDVLATDFSVYLYPGHARSISCYRRRAAPEPSAVGAAWLLLERRLPAQALEVLAAAEPSAESLNLRGMAHHQVGDLEEARRWYTAALALDARYEPASLNLEALERQVMPD